MGEVFSTPVVEVDDSNSSPRTDDETPQINTNALTKVYTDQSKMSDIDVWYLLKEYGNFSAEMAAIFTAICFRESSYRPRIVNEFGFTGLFQIGTKEIWSTNLAIDLIKPNQTSVKVWQLVLSDLDPESKEVDSREKIEQIINSRAKSAGQAEFYAGASDALWMPVNQVRWLRTKLSQKDYSKQVVTGNTVSKCVFNPWGESFLKNSWMTSVKYEIAKNVYIRAGNNDKNKLKDWVLANVPKDSTAWYTFDDAEHKDKTKIEAWVNEEVHLGEQYGNWKNGVFTPSRNATSQDVWK